MSGVASAPSAPSAPGQAAGWLSLDTWRRLFRDRPLIPLLVLLGVLVLLFELGPGSVSANWIGVTFRAAIPLAILAGCQTLAMLTGGIDLSVGAVASAAGFLVATLVTVGLMTRQRRPWPLSVHSRKMPSPASLLAP